jgi:hypothetical protein
MGRIKNWTRIILAFLLPLTACDMVDKPVQPIIVQYPNAQQVRVEQEASFIEVKSFSTPDTADAVLTFYEKELKEAGWSLNTKYADGFTFGYSSNPGQPAYRLEIVVAPSLNGSTNVQVKLVTENPA